MCNTFCSRLSLLLVIFLGLRPLGLSAQTVTAASAPSHDGPAWSFTLGQLHAAVDSRLKGTSQSGVLLSVDAERDLGLPAQAVEPWSRIEYRINPDWHVYGEYFDNRRSGSVMRYTTVKLFGWLPLVVGTRYQTDLRFTHYRLGAGYTLLRTNAFEGGISAGLDVLDAQLDMRTTTAPLAVAPTLKGVVPLPTLGLFARYRLTPNDSLIFRTEGLPLRIRQYKVATAQIFAAYEHELPFGLGLGLGYLSHDFLLATDEPGRARDGRYSYTSRMVYVTARF